MTSQKSKKSSSHHKLPKLPDHAKVRKRPLFRPATPSPYANASQPKVVYVKVSTPFMSAVQRVRKLLRQVDKRAAQGAAARGDKPKGARLVANAALGLEDAKKEEVLVKGSGRAIQKVVELAAWFQQRASEEGVTTRLRTSSITAIDDIEYDEDNEDVEQMEVETDGTTKDGMDMEIPETRVRQLSVLELRISWA